MEEIANCFYRLDDIAENVEQKTQKEHTTAFLAKILVKILYNYQLYIQKKEYYSYFALDIMIGYFEGIQYSIENEKNLISKNMQIYIEQFNARLIQLKAKS